MKKINKKKKGFTLIELVIVLAVLAIIALIAIPNFTKVRNDSLLKADERTVEQIEKITLMAIANEDIKVPTDDKMTLELTFNGDGKINTVSATDVKAGYTDMLQEVKKPQVNGKTAYQVTVMTSGEVDVITTPTTTS